MYDTIDIALKVAWLLMALGIVGWALVWAYREGRKSGWEDALEARRYNERMNLKRRESDGTGVCSVRPSTSVWIGCVVS